MLIFAIDDALKALMDLHNVIVKAASEEKVMIQYFQQKFYGIQMGSDNAVNG